MIPEQNQIQTDEQLMILLQKGHESVFEVLFDRHAEKLIRYLDRYTKNTEDARDLCQEVFVRILESAQRYNPQYRFTTWLYTIAGNMARNQLRDEKKRRELVVRPLQSNEPQDAGLTHHIENDRIENRVQDILGSLNARERTFYELRFLQQMSIREMSKTMGIPEGTIKSGLFYFLKKISSHLKEQNL